MARIARLPLLALGLAVSLTLACAPAAAPSPTAAPAAKPTDAPKPTEAAKPAAPTSAQAATPPAAPAAKPAAAREGWPAELRFGLVPTESSTDITGRWAPLFDHLTKTLGVPVKPMVANDYTAVIEAMRFEKIELAYFGPKAYIEAAERSKAEAIALEDTLKGGTGYYSWLISKKGGPITTFEQTKGKTFAFVDPESTSGYLVPLAHFLLTLNTKPEAYFGKVSFSGSHEAGMLLVKNGTVDVAAVNDLDVDRAAQSGKVSRDDFNILWQSDKIAGSPIAVRSPLPASFKQAAQEAIISFNDPNGLQQLQLKGFAKADDKVYDPLRKVNEAAQKAKQG